MADNAPAKAERHFIVGISGASGAIYGVRLVEAMLRIPEIHVHLIITNAGHRVMRDEINRDEFKNADVAQSPSAVQPGNAGGSPAPRPTTSQKKKNVAQSDVTQAASRPPKLSSEGGTRPPKLPSEGGWRTYFTLTDDQAARIHHHPNTDIGAGPASGTFLTEAMIVCPCSMNTVSLIAHGLQPNLLTRAAAVTLKEGRPLLLVPRETPVTLIDLRNMTAAAESGVIILPASPGFYHAPKTIDDLVNFIVQKIMDRMGLKVENPVRWTGGS